MSPETRDDTWGERALDAAPGGTAALLWIFTALYFRPGIDLLLLFGILLAGGGMLAQMALHWARGRSSTRSALAAAVAGILLAAFAGVELAHRPQGPGGLLRVCLQLLMLVSFVFMVRVQRQEKTSRP